LAPYKVKEIFLTLQGEGAHTGRRAVFCRFSGCNLWSGREKDRKDSICQFCDTDFVGINGENGGTYNHSESLAARVETIWGNSQNGRFVVVTGGEPLLQLDFELVHAFQSKGFLVAIETNGTLVPPENVDWICVSPKAGTTIRIIKGNELKLVFPQSDLEPSKLSSLHFERFYLQPMDGENLAENTRLAAAYCLGNPPWRLCLQTHKILGIQ